MHTWSATGKMHRSCASRDLTEEGRLTSPRSTVARPSQERVHVQDDQRKLQVGDLTNAFTHMRHGCCATYKAGPSLSNGGMSTPSHKMLPRALRVQGGLIVGHSAAIPSREERCQDGHQVRQAMKGLANCRNGADYFFFFMPRPPFLGANFPPFPPFSGSFRLVDVLTDTGPKNDSNRPAGPLTHSGSSFPQDTHTQRPDS